MPIIDCYIEDDDWHKLQQIEGDELPPIDKVVQVKCYGGMEFLASRVNGYLDEDDNQTWCWVAESEGEHPPCWHDRVCWANNMDEEHSDPVIGWRYQ